MASYGTKGGDGGYAYLASGTIDGAQPVCGAITYVIGTIACLTCCTQNPIKGRQGEIRGEHKFTCRTCKTSNVYTDVRFIPAN